MVINTCLSLTLSNLVLLYIKSEYNLTNFK